MAKRPASDSLEQTDSAPSPALKRVRLEDADTENGDAIVEPDVSMRKHEEDDDDDDDDDEHSHNDNNDYGEEDEDEDEDAELQRGTSSRQSAPAQGYSDLYLDTIDRTLLDFDFEKLCSVTLSNVNVYACLVCGRYYQGRGPKSQAYFHALDEGHHVYINMETRKVYVLPEGYEVKSRSLDDIKFVADPKLPREEVLALDRTRRTEWDLVGRKYTPGFVGMNNLKANDYFNVVAHALAHVAPLRNYLMLEDMSSRPQLAQRFALLVRKIWNPRAFKAHVSPHELLQEVAQRSGKRFTLTEQSDPVEFLSWFLNNLHLALGGSRSKPGSSIVQKVFQGRLKVESQAITARADAADRLRFEEADVQTTISHYMILTLDLPPAPLFQDGVEGGAIPQVALTGVLSKYDGRSPQERLNTRVRYRLLHPLPPFLLLHVKRFSANKFVAERNPTIVTFSPRSLDMAPYVEPDPKVQGPGEPVWYDLAANVTHEAVRMRDDSVEGETERRVWRVQLRDKSREAWVEVQDLFVDAAAGDTLFTKESYLQVWEQRRGRGRDK